MVLRMDHGSRRPGMIRRRAAADEPISSADGLRGTDRAVKDRRAR
jgi:hypothetical protein